MCSEHETALVCAVKHTLLEADQHLAAIMHHEVVFGVNQLTSPCRSPHAHEALVDQTRFRDTLALAARCASLQKNGPT